MMTNNELINRAIFRKIAGILLFLFLGILISFSQSNNLTGNLPDRFSKWYTPILQKHNIDLKKYNYGNIFTIPKENINSSDTTIAIFLELGTLDLQNNNTITLSNAILISNGPNTGYEIRTSENYFRDIDKNIIEYKKGKTEYFKLLLDTIPLYNIPFQEWKDQFSVKLDPESHQIILGVAATIK